MIPKNISREHILKAMQQIDNSTPRIPSEREATKYYLFHNDKTYPPKYVISIANKFANGRELDPHSFNGGGETNRVLERLKFQIQEIAHPQTARSVTPALNAEKISTGIDDKPTDDNLARWRRSLIRVLDKLDGAQNEGRGVVSRIRSLSSQERIPRHVAACMIVVVEVRNASEYGAHLSAAERTAASYCWLAISEWTKASGILLPA
jgi:hypothetical protein